MSASVRRRLGWLLVRVLRLVGLRVDPVLPGSMLLSRGSHPPEIVVQQRSGALLVRRSQARRDWFALEKALAHHLVNEHVAAVLRKYRVNCVFDVGANKGQYATSLRKVGYRGWIHSFEPVPRDFAVLSAAAASDPRWEVHRMGLGSVDGEMEINVVPGTLSSFLPASEFGSERFARLLAPVVETADVRRLDGLLDGLLAGLDAPRPYLKLDTQGFDLEAFAGLGARAAEFVGMQSEVSLLQIYAGMPRLPEALAVYEAAGFEVTAFYQIGRQVRTARVPEFDCVMVRPDALRPRWPATPEA